MNSLFEESILEILSKLIFVILEILIFVYYEMDYYLWEINK